MRLYSFFDARHALAASDVVLAWILPVEADAAIDVVAGEFAHITARAVRISDAELGADVGVSISIVVDAHIVAVLLAYGVVIALYFGVVNRTIGSAPKIIMLARIVHALTVVWTIGIINALRLTITAARLDPTRFGVIWRVLVGAHLVVVVPVGMPHGLTVLALEEFYVVVANDKVPAVTRVAAYISITARITVSPGVGVIGMRGPACAVYARPVRTAIGVIVALRNGFAPRFDRAYFRGVGHVLIDAIVIAVVVVACRGAVFRLNELYAVFANEIIDVIAVVCVDPARGKEREGK